MPELPDLTVYLEHIEARMKGESLRAMRLVSPFVLRSVSPEKEIFIGRSLVGTRRLGKQLVLEFEGQLFVVIHLMISGRLHWKKAGANVPKRGGLAAWDFDGGSLTLTEASKKKRASIRLVEGEDALQELNPGGLEVLGSSLDAFAAVLADQRHTIKRVLTDQRILAGVGNAYSDEILLVARMSPFKPAQGLETEEVERLHAACQAVLTDWTDRLRTRSGDKFPEKVTAFHPEMGAHGKYREPCPQCGSPVQRIRFADNESNYCAACQTGGKLLADRSLSRLLKDSWPRTLEELEQSRGGPSQ